MPQGRVEDLLTIPKERSIDPTSEMMKELERAEYLQRLERSLRPAMSSHAKDVPHGELKPFVVGKSKYDYSINPEERAIYPSDYLQGLADVVSNTFDIEGSMASGDPIGGMDISGNPFSWYAKQGKLPYKNKLFHGTQRVFDKFDPKRNQPHDVLGWLTHTAEDPKYAIEGYMMGQQKGIQSIPNWDEAPVKKSELKPKWSTEATPVPRVLPIVPEAKNVLDLIEPNIDDLSQALASVPKADRAGIIREFKRLRKGFREGSLTTQPRKRSPGWENVGTGYGYDASDIIKHEKMREGLTNENVLERWLAENIRLDPENFKNTPFDAIRYHDMEHRSWAFDENVPFKTPWGTELNEPPKDIKVLRTDKDYGGKLEEAPDRWANTSLSLPNQPIEEIYKTKPETPFPLPKTEVEKEIYKASKYFDELELTDFEKNILDDTYVSDKAPYEIEEQFKSGAISADEYGKSFKDKMEKIGDKYIVFDPKHKFGYIDSLKTEAQAKETADFHKGDYLTVDEYIEETKKHEPAPGPLPVGDKTKHVDYIKSQFQSGAITKEEFKEKFKNQAKKFKSIVEFSDGEIFGSSKYAKEDDIYGSLSNTKQYDVDEYIEKITKEADPLESDDVPGFNYETKKWEPGTYTVIGTDNKTTASFDVYTIDEQMHKALNDSKDKITSWQSHEFKSSKSSKKEQIFENYLDDIPGYNYDTMKWNTGDYTFYIDNGKTQNITIDEMDDYWEKFLEENKNKIMSWGKGFNKS